MCNDSYSSHSLPGWESTSVAFHTDDGALYQSSEEGTPTNQLCKRGDVIKCTVRTIHTDTVVQSNRLEVLFSCNGVRVASVPTDIPPGGFYGAIGMMSLNEKVTLFPPVASQKKRFQDVWHIMTPQLVSHREDGICMYTGLGESSEDSIGSVRGKMPIEPLGELLQRSFALRILNSGEKDYIGMGVVNKAYPSNLLPGWEDTSIGYHADTGDIFNNSSDGYSTHQPCKKGDVMECIVQAVDNSPKQVKVTFLKNGSQVTEVTAWTPHNGFYFGFGMMSKSEMVQVILPEVHTPFNTPKLNFEDVWEVKTVNIEHRGSGMCHYLGIGDVGTIRSKLPIDPFGFAKSFEVKIIDPGNKCYIALGICSEKYSTGDLPGWEDLSVGFHADSGCILQKSGGEESTKNPCSKGDVIRCTLEPVDGSDKQMNVIFHKNDCFVGKAIFWKPGGGKVHAQIGCMSVGEVVQIASPLQKISHLKPDRITSPLTHGDYPSLPSSSVERQSDQYGYHGDLDPHLQASHEEQMQRFLYSMYQHMHNSPQFKGRSTPFPQHPMPPTQFGDRHGAHRGGYPGLPSFDYSLSFPPPVLQENVQKLASHQSEPAGHKEYYKQTSSSSSASESPSHYSSQLSTSSQFSVSSLETVPEQSDTKMPQYQESMRTNIQSHPLHIELTGSPEATQGEHLAKKSEVLYAAKGSIAKPLTTKTPYHRAEVIGLDEPDIPSLSTSEEATSLCSCDTPTQVLLQKSLSIVVEPNILSKDENKLFQILHNTSIADDGSLQHVNLLPDSPNKAFIMFRLPLNEKLSYFQIELLELSENSNIAIGLVWDHYPVYHLPGVLEGSIAFHTQNSALLSGKQSNKLNTESLHSAGDIIGCRVALQFKSEILTALNKNHIKVEFYKMACFCVVKTCSCLLMDFFLQLA